MSGVDESFRAAFGERIRAERQRRGWSMRGAAARLHIKVPTLGMYERGQRNAPLDVAASIAEAYGLRLDIVPDRVGGPGCAHHAIAESAVVRICLDCGKPEPKREG